MPKQPEKETMDLGAALQQSGGATKHVDSEVPGTYTVDKANVSAGYYKDFQPDDPECRSDVSTSQYYGYDYPNANPLENMTRVAGKEGWQPR